MPALGPDIIFTRPLHPCIFPAVLSQARLPARALTGDVYVCGTSKAFCPRTRLCRPRRLWICSCQSHKVGLKVSVLTTENGDLAATV